jgi:hypothetical protein
MATLPMNIDIDRRIYLALRSIMMRRNPRCNQASSYVEQAFTKVHPNEHDTYKSARSNEFRWLRLSGQNFRVDKWSLCRG